MIQIDLGPNPLVTGSLCSSNPALGLVVVDDYYAYDITRPPTIDRSFFGGALFTTQPARNDEFNVNLAYIEANISGNKIHGRFALQAGTSATRPRRRSAS